MISSVSSSTPVNQYAQQTQQTSQAAKPKKAEPQDTVVLSHQAKAAVGDPDHDGD